MLFIPWYLLIGISDSELSMILS